MDFPLQIAFEDIASRDDLRATVREEFARLGELGGLIKAGRVVLGRPQRRNHRAGACRVRIEIEGVDGASISITRDPAITGADEEASTVVGDAFKSLRRRLVQLGAGPKAMCGSGRGPAGPRRG